MRNVVAEKANSEYLKGVINNGVHSENHFGFFCTSPSGVKDGYGVIYNKNNGTITRIDRATGDKIVFGNPLDSTDERGYIAVLISAPYVPNTYSDKSVYRNEEGEPVAVEFICYIHRIAAFVWAKLNNIDIEGNLVGNHKNGCKLDNRYINIELVTNLENNLHGAVYNSFLNNGQFQYMFCKRANKIKEFNSLKDEYIISAKWVTEYMKLNSKFKEQVTECKNDLIAGSRVKNKRYISYFQLYSFSKWLVKMGYWRDTK